MLADTQHSRGWLVLLGLLVGVGGSAAQSGQAQQTSDNGYAVTEGGEVQAPDAVPPAGAQENTGPVRLARFAYVQGNVTWRTDENTDWSTATLNLPLRQGAQIWVSDGGRAEIQFDDGSLLRLGTGAVVTLQTLYSDSEGEFTELKMTEGLATLHLRHDRGVYQVNTPLGSVKAAGPADLRIGVGNGLEVAVQRGKATLEGSQGKADLQSGDFLDLSNSNSPYTIRDIPRPDSWDRWNQERDDLLARAESEPATEHLPADIAIVAPDLSDYGTWRDDSEYGWVWCPRVSSPEWRPYHDGHWTWVNPFGWTWVSSEAWGWAPYHYGTWVSKPYGWAWCPGPVNQYWSPAVVHFSECGGQIGWCALAPGEVHYPATIGFGFRSGNWATYFSIGGAAVYYPNAYGYCVPRVYDTRYVNRVTYVTKVTNVTNIYNGNNASITRFGMSQESYAANHNTYLSQGVNFVPRNSRTAAGVTSVASAEFGGRGTYMAVAKADTSLFTRGRAIAAPPQGVAPLAGPITVRPTPQSLTPTRTFTATPQAGVVRQARPVYRAPVMSNIARNSAPITPTGRVVLPSQAGVLNPVPGASASGSVLRNGRPLPYDRTPTNAGRTGGTIGQTPGRVQVQPRGDNSQYPGRSRVETPPANAGANPTRRSPGGDPRPTNSAAEAAAAARASLGAGRTRPGGSSADANGNSDRTPRTPPYNGANGNADRTPRYPQNNGSTGNADRTPRYPQNNGSNGSADRAPRPPQYNGSNGSNDRAPRPPQYNGSNGSATSGSSGERSAPTYTPRPPQSAPPRNEPPRSYPPQSAPPRSEPPRNDPPRSAPPRSEPQRNDAPRSNPPAREPDKTPPNKDNGSDSTNRGRPGRG